MKRLVTAATVSHVLLALLLLGLAGYALSYIPGKSGSVRGLVLGAVAFTIPGVLQLIGVRGLWKQKLWGWWLLLSTDILMAALLAYVILDDFEIDLDLLIPAICISALAIVLLLPPVRKHCRHGSAALPVSGA